MPKNLNHIRVLRVIRILRILTEYEKSLDRVSVPNSPDTYKRFVCYLREQRKPKHNDSCGGLASYFISTVLGLGFIRLDLWPIPHVTISPHAFMGEILSVEDFEACVKPSELIKRGSHLYTCMIDRYE